MSHDEDDDAPENARDDPAPALAPEPEGMRGRRRRGYVLENQIGFLIRKAQQRHLSIFAAHIPEALTAQQFAVMAKLAETGPCSQNALGRQTAMDNSTINGVVSRLVERELVAKLPSEEDRRMHVVALTPEGERVVARALPMAAEITRLTLAPLTPAERATLVRLVRKIT
ncbi:MarR family winged helix-turn-helix transcriptional regulator [Salinarimonas sp.]|uniref:MarR family winged helix-turn-helix transcriptional regulator n=1 Tax=Salinarimonas sp. TaxID=2766526 RepID=UPI003918EEAD